MLKKIGLAILFIVAVIYIGVCSYLTFNQRNLIYLPVKDEKDISYYNLPGYKEISFTSDENVQINAWYKLPTKKNAQMIIYFHGNHGNLAKRINKFKRFTDDGWGLFAFDYRGYGRSTSKPTENGLYQDGRAAINYVNEVLKVQIEDTIFYGESLGTGVVTKMALEFSPKLLVLEAPYTSISDAGKVKYPYLPLDLLVVDNFNSLARIKKINIPLLILHGKLDTTVEHWQGEKLYDNANHPKKFISYDDKGHSDFDVKNTKAEILKFLEILKTEEYSNQEQDH